MAHFEDSENDVEEYSDTREAFLAWLELYPRWWGELSVLAADVNGHLLTLGQVLDSVQECLDILPGWACDEVDLPSGSTYADAAAEIRRWHKWHT